ncbi:ribonuclease H-like domain-containing protein [Mycena amicta]|nr:ribonuclease H-like domain-containing protein [Mycena amicta]
MTVRLSEDQLDEALTEAQLMLILDVKTRWTSTHQMLRTSPATHLDAIDRYTRANPDLVDALLSDDDWNALQLVREWLSSFRQATTEMSTTSKPMLSQTHLVFRMLQTRIRYILRNLSPNMMYPELIEGLTAAHTKLSDYYFTFDASPYYLWASLLDPRIGYTTLKEEYKDDRDLLFELESAKTSLGNEYRRKYGPTTTQPSAEPSTAWRATCIASQVSLTVHVFLANNIPGSAVAVERVFSGGRDTIALRRASLKAETIQTLMVLKAHIRLTRKEVIEVLDEADAMDVRDEEKN